MADKLMRYYQYVADEKGLDGKIKLAQLTHVPSARAAMDPDAPDVIQKFKDAVRQITGKMAPSY